MSDDLRLYEVANGYTGFSYVHVLVVAKSEGDACKAARPVFKEEARKSRSSRSEKHLRGITEHEENREFFRYKPAYWERLEAKELGIIEEGFVSEVRN